MTDAALTSPHSEAWSAPRIPADAQPESPRLEDVLLAAILSIMVLLPVAEIVFRQLGARGISASTTIVQHCTLGVSMIGAAMTRAVMVGGAVAIPCTHEV